MIQRRNRNIRDVFRPTRTSYPCIPNCIDMVEKALKSHVTASVITRSWDGVGTDLLPYLGGLMSLTSGLKRAFLHTPVAQDVEEAAKAWVEKEKEKQELRDARKVSWMCPICGEVLPNSTWKITNGKDKGLSLKHNNVKYCMDIESKAGEDED